MELFFLLLLVVIMATALGSGFPVAFALPGSAIITVALAALCGYLFTGNPDAYFTHGGPVQWLSAGVTNFRGVYWEVERDTLIAIPLFIFMGIMLQRSRIAEDLLVTMAQLFGPMPGGLGISVVLVGALLAATTGIVGATVVAMGLISLPAMLRNNYSHSLATGTISASGTLGQIIPPSIVLIILADQLASATDQASSARKALYKESTGELSMPSAFDVSSTSAGEMFLGALIPGLILVGIYVTYIAVLAFFRPKLAPAVPYEGKYDWAFALRVLLILVPPLALIFVVLGSIIMGVATVNQAGSIGAAGALIMAGYRLCEGNKRTYWPVCLAVLSLLAILVVVQTNPINIRNISTPSDEFWLVVAVIAVGTFLFSLLWSGWRVFKVENTLNMVMLETAKTTSLVFIILLGAAMLTAAFRAFGGEELVKDFLTGLPGGFWGQFFIVMLVIFILGFFLDFIEIAVVVVPIVAPILLADPSANVTAVWLGVMIGLNIQTSFLTPPFGFALFYLRGVAPAIVKTVSMYKGVIAFIGLQLTALVIVAFNPQLVNYLPQRVSLTSETAPPPINPRLQHCIEKSLFQTYRENQSAFTQAISRVNALDLSILPQSLQNDLKESFTKAGGTFALVGDVEKASAEIDNRADAYRPLHSEVRSIEKSIRDIEERIKGLNITLGRNQRADDTDQDAINSLKAQIGALRAEQEKLKASIPSIWSEKNKEFVSLLNKEKIARQKYRRNVDNAYEPVRETIQIIEDDKKLETLETDLKALESVVATKPFAEAVEVVAKVIQDVRGIAGNRSIRSPLSKVRRSLRGRTPDRDKASAELAKAISAFEKERTWRKTASESLLQDLKEYEATIRYNIGLRMQPKIPDDQAIALAGCAANHRDISLNF
ncbi:MAG: TRAP transporter large permease subunit [Pseudomonadota bacterium]